MLYDEIPKECLVCDMFDKCHKITIATCLHCIRTDIELMIQNGLENGTIKPFLELEKIRKKRKKKRKRIKETKGRSKKDR